MADVLTGESLNLSNFLADSTIAIVAHCSKNAIPDEYDQLVLADMVESTFSGYAAVPITNWDCFPNDDIAYGEAVSDPVSFQASDGLVPELVTSIYLTIQRGTQAAELWRVYQIPGGILMDVPGRTISRQVRLNSFDETLTPVD